MVKDYQEIRMVLSMCPHFVLSRAFYLWQDLFISNISIRFDPRQRADSRIFRNCSSLGLEICCRYAFRPHVPGKNAHRNHKLLKAVSTWMHAKIYFNLQQNVCAYKRILIRVDRPELNVWIFIFSIDWLARANWLVAQLRIALHHSPPDKNKMASRFVPVTGEQIFVLNEAGCSPNTIKESHRVLFKIQKLINNSWGKHKEKS
jgi:hypothetical protein